MSGLDKLNEIEKKVVLLIAENKILKEDKYNQGVTMGNQFDSLVEYKQKLKKINELIEKESDLDLHPEAEELDINRRIMSILNKFQEILKD